MPEASRHEGLFGSLRGSAASLLALARVRLDLFATELQEEKVRAGLTLVYGAAAVFCLSFGVLFLAIAVTVMLWDSNRLLALGVFSAIFLTCGAFFAVTARRYAHPGKRPFAESVAELKRDGEALKREP
ncbi:MAG TPA: phage holin family protein [Rhodocyclaceae bacterium]|nr:phage holin family protein [Rhodocyclaceae bacterium]